MRLAYRSIYSIAFLILFFNGLANDNRSDIDRYLDSCTKYMQLKRPDLVVQFNMRADTISNTILDLPFEVKYQIHNNYNWVFGLANKPKLRKYHLKQIIDLIEKDKVSGVTHFLNYQFSISNLASIFNQEGNSDSAKIYYKLAIELAKKNNDPRYIAGSLNNMGIFLSDYKGWDSAKVYFDKALKYVETDIDNYNVIYASIRDNISDYYIDKNDTSSAITIIQENLRILNLTHRQADVKFVRWGLKLLPMYFQNNMLDQADNLILDIKKILDGKKGEWRYINTKKLLEYEIEIAQLRDDRQLINQLMLRQVEFLEAYLNFMRERNASINKKISEYESYSTDQELALANEAIQKARIKEKRNRVLLIISLLVSTLIIALIISNYRRRIKIKIRDNQLKAQELEIAELEKEKIGFQLENKSRDFSNLLMQSTMQEDWSKYLVDKLRSIHKKGENGSEELKTLILELKQKGSVYTKIHELQKGMEEANTQFFKDLETKFPALTKAERETCGLIRMNMQAKEIALLRNISPSSVRKLRQRIRNKMELDPKEDLYGFIKEI